MLFEPYKSYASFMTMRSSAHLVRRLEVTKKVLTPVNNKVFQESATYSRPLGHWRNREAWVV